ncbi:LysR family transcriptional regulator [Lacisediminihabitans changchengi]|uniref:LysR family transcriptional regulator n=1 Tax=Lacisediminihabitans changchengi TaxID=2787634 RepID=A0A934SRD6_9MICO|nr:LysR family transcriptional regulator [Lacisediminihabitans changchengi]MBK4347585.1 LysR family transcriptional regulator [Lacisediminihabitans changchengi]
MDTRQLEYFVAVAEELNFTRAAARLFAVQSTVSAGIRSLEHDLGTPLFERSTKRVALTSAGSRALPEARSAIEAIDRVRSAAAENSRDIRGRLRVGIFTSLDYLDLPGLFGEFHERYPLVDLQLTASASGSTGFTDDVRRGRVDLAFMGLAAQDLAGFQVLELTRSDFVAIVPSSHPLAGRAQVDLAELTTETWVDTPAGFGNRVIIDRALAERGLSRTIGAQVSELGAVAQFVAAGLGIAVIPIVAYSPTPATSAVTLEPPVTWSLSAITRPGASPAIAALLDLLAERFVGARRA